MRWFLVVFFYCSISSVRSDVEDETPFLRIMARSTVYNAGETKAIFCKGKHIVEPIEWYSPSGKKVDVRSTKNTRVYVEKRTGKDEEYLVPLIIHHIKISDSGNWTCKAGDFSDHIDIIVGVKVNLTERNQTLEGEEGKTIRLTCEARGYPTPVIVWYRENSQIQGVKNNDEFPIVFKQHLTFSDDTKKYIIRPDNSLEIRKLDHTDIGIYICKVRQKAISYYTDKTVHLSVQHKPILYNSDTQTIYTKYKTEEIYAILNETKNITCSAIANPPPTYRWYRRNDGFDDGPIVDPETVITSEDGTNSVLVLRMHDETYLGEYKCTATNNRGAESIVFHVSIGTKPDPPDFVSVAAINVTELVFNVTCSTCIMQTPEDVSPNPQNLTVLGYSFQLVPVRENYPPDWDAATEILVDVTDPDDTLFTVGPLSNSTIYHVRVRTRNAAGFSDWFEVAETPKTANEAIRMTITLLLFIANFVFTLCY